MSATWDIKQVQVSGSVRPPQCLRGPGILLICDMKIYRGYLGNVLENGQTIAAVTVPDN